MRVPSMLMDSPEIDDWTCFSYMCKLQCDTIKSPGYKQIKNDVN